MSVRKSRENYRQIYGKAKASLWRNLSTGTPPKFFRTILCFVALVYNWYFFENSRFTEIIRHYIRFSYKHGNFSHVCLLVKMALKTVTRYYCLPVRSKNLLFLSLYPRSRVISEACCSCKQLQKLQNHTGLSSSRCYVITPERVLQATL